MRTTALLLLTLAFALARAEDPTGLSDAEFDAQFVCPEHLKDDAARRAEIEGFVAWLMEHHPGLTLEELAGWRLRLLEKHGCATTLDAIRAGLPDAR
jgi:hypothetical protein